MTLKKDPSRRWVELDLELPGTPEDVWHAMATGPGYAAWFMPADIEPREGGAIAFHFAPGVTSSGRVTAWQPPARFAFEEPGWSGDAPPLATEILIEARAGGTCAVRLVTSLFTSKDDWDDELEGMERGWRGFFHLLRLYLATCPGAHAASGGASVALEGSPGERWSTLREALGLSTVAVGDACDTSAHGAPRLAGIVEELDAQEGSHALVLRVEQPCPGAAELGVYESRRGTRAVLTLKFYGADSDRCMAEEDPRWDAWLKQLFGTGVAA